MAFERTITVTEPWGKALRTTVAAYPGGMQALHGRIVQALPTAGSRATLSRLYDFSDPDHIEGENRFRAWLVLTALGESPVAWCISDDVVPDVFDIELLRDRLPRPGDHGAVAAGTGRSRDEAVASALDVLAGAELDDRADAWR